MKRSTCGILAAMVFGGVASAQTDLPANPLLPSTPKKFTTRPIGSGTSGGVEVIPRDGADKQKVRYTTHIILSVSRLWTSTEGKLVEGKLIAFEDLVAETTKGAPQPTTPEPPASPTVVRDEKVRLLVNQKPVEIAINRLSPGDQEFIAQVRKAYAKKAP